jgi:hypothetical protein
MLVCALLAVGVAWGGSVLEDAAFKLDLRGDANANGFLDQGEIGNAYDFSATSPTYFFYGGNGTSNGATVGYSTDKYGRLPQQLDMRVTNPFYPYTTNTQTCLYFYQDRYTNASDVVYIARSGVTMAGAAVTGDVITIYARFRWDGATCSPNTLVSNGFTAWTTAGLLLYLDDNGQIGGLTDASMKGCGLSATKGEWTDVFMTASNIVVNGANKADVTFNVCKTPAHANDATEFKPPVISTAKMQLSPMNIPSGRPLSLGCYFGNNTAGYATWSSSNPRAFIGALADVMIWRRALTKDEMCEVMAGQHGAKWMVGAKNGSSNEFGDAAPENVFEPEKMPWRKMRKSLTAANPTLTLKSPLPAVETNMPMIFTVSPILQGTAASCPVQLAVNGNAVGTFDLAIPSKRNMAIPKSFWKRDANGNVTVTLTRTETTGTLLIDSLALSGSWQISPEDKKSGGLKDQRINTDYYFAGDPVEGHATASDSVGNARTNFTFGVWMPAGSAARNGWRFTMRIINCYTHTGNLDDIVLKLSVNDEVLATRWGLGVNDYFDVDIPAGTLVDGMNWLRFTQTSPVTGSGTSYNIFDFWRMTLIPPADGTCIIIR